MVNGREEVGVVSGREEVRVVRLIERRTYIYRQKNSHCDVNSLRLLCTYQHV